MKQLAFNQLKRVQVPPLLPLTKHITKKEKMSIQEIIGMLIIALVSGFVTAGLLIWMDRGISRSTSPKKK